MWCASLPTAFPSTACEEHAAKSIRVALSAHRAPDLPSRTHPGPIPDPSRSSLAQVALSQTCDILQLLPPTPKSSWVGVSMYVDDKGAERVASCLRLGKLSREPPRKRALVGVAKQLPPNRRASEVCRQCGLSVEVLGDAFVARAWDDQEGYERQHFDAAQQPRRAVVVASCARFFTARAREHRRSSPRTASG